MKSLEKTSTALFKWLDNNIVKRNLNKYLNKSFPLRISLVNVNKSAVSCGLFTFTKEIFNGKLYFLCSVECEIKNSSYEKLLGVKLG